MSKRKYTKRSEYWKKFNISDHPSHASETGEETSPDLLGEPFYTSDASYSDVSEARRQGASTIIQTYTTVTLASVWDCCHMSILLKG